VPLGKAKVARSGHHVTIVALAKMLDPALAAAEQLSSEDISAEIIDPRSLSPLDVDTIARSVKKTGHLVIIHEAVEQGGVAGEIAARAQESAFHYLDSPIVRVAAPFAPIPASPALEKNYLPGKQRLVETVRKMLSRS
jgi:pyruvate/2-oxoglutarate/acetoin dehydrogenase E1 component